MRVCQIRRLCLVLVVLSVNIRNAACEKPDTGFTFWGKSKSSKRRWKKTKQQRRRQKEGKQQRQRLSPSPISIDSTILTWEEDTAYFDWATTSHEFSLAPASKPKRRLIWFGRTEEGSYHPAFRRTQEKLSTGTPHPLRMEQWNFTIAWSEDRRVRSPKMTFEFHENGYVRCLHPNVSVRRLSTVNTQYKRLQRRHYKEHTGRQDDVAMYVVGRWKLAPSGVVWDMTWDNKHYSFYADLHLNPFGPHPKMFRGLVIRDRFCLPSKWLRPITARFTGVGVGKDTADFSYKERSSGSSTLVQHQQ